MSLLAAYVGMSGSGRILTAGNNGGSVGFSNGGGGGSSYGSLQPLVDQNGLTIDIIADSAGTDFYYVIEGNHTGATFTTITVGGTSFSRASADVANGTYDVGTDSTAWAWTGSAAGLVSGQGYTWSVT